MFSLFGEDIKGEYYFEAEEKKNDKNDKFGKYWDCNKCGFDNFANRSVCFRCQTFKNADEIDQTMANWNKMTK